VFVSCDTSAARRAWRAQLGAEYTFASDFWPHGAAAKAYGVFNERNGAPLRGTFLIDKAGTVVWSLVEEDDDEQRTELVSGPLGAISE
jgi:peroxiredoxin (alkyl hydroperoxide reductase subunit C)